MVVTVKRTLFFIWATLAVVIITGVFMMVFQSCAYTGAQGVAVKVPDPFTPDPSCTIYADMGIDPATSTATIPQYIKNPCAAQNILATVAKSGVALEAYQVDEFEVWAAGAKQAITVGMTFENVKLYIGGQLTRINGKLGMVYFITSDLLLVLPDAALVQTEDATLMHASLDDLVRKVRQLAIMYGR